MTTGPKHKSSLPWTLATGWLPPIAWMSLIFFLSDQPDLPRPESGWLMLVVSSAAHFCMFGVLAILWARVLGHGRTAWLIALVLTVLYGLSDEFHQAFVPGRTPDPWDVAFDAAGALLAVWMWRRLPVRTRLALSA